MENSERYKVTEREAGTGRIEYPARADQSGEDAQDIVPSAHQQGEKPASVMPAPTSHDPKGSSAILPTRAEVVEESGTAPTPTVAVVTHEQESQLRGLCGNDQIMLLVESIRLHPLYIEWSKRLMAAERSRRFCLHQISHQLDVARIAYIRALERKMSFRKEVIYAAALLHDIGKAVQYEEGEPHEIAGARIATDILNDIPGFSALEKTAIVAAIAQHRRYSDDSSPLGKLLFEADKASRPCFACPMREECSWSAEKQNQGVKI